jgi:hypothetical protein
VRPWRQIAEQACQEKDSECLLVLCQELEQALDEQVEKKRKAGVLDLQPINDGRRSA